MRKGTYRIVKKKQPAAADPAKKKQAEDKDMAKVEAVFEKALKKYDLWPDQRRRPWEEEAVRVNRKRAFKNPPLAPIDGFALYICDELRRVKTGYSLFMQNWFMK